MKERFNFSFVSGKECRWTSMIIIHNCEDTTIWSWFYIDVVMHQSALIVYETIKLCKKRNFIIISKVFLFINKKYCLKEDWNRPPWNRIITPYSFESNHTDKIPIVLHQIIFSIALTLVTPTVQWTFFLSDLVKSFIKLC